MAKFLRLPALFGEDYIVNAELVTRIVNLTAEHKAQLVAQNENDTAWRGINAIVELETESGRNKVFTTKTLDQLETELNGGVHNGKVH